MPRQPTRIRSFRRVFKTEWRWTHLWNWDLTNLVPGGIPIAPVLVAFGVVTFVWLLGQTPFGLLYDLRVPGLGPILPDWLRYLTLPVAAGMLAGREAPDGRVFYLYGYKVVRQAWRRQRERIEAQLGDWTDDPSETRVRWDDSAADIKDFEVTGPARVTLNRPVTFSKWAPLVATGHRGSMEGPVVLMSREQMKVRAR